MFGNANPRHRPAVIISASQMSRFGLPIVLPVTRTKLGYATHVELEEALPVTGYVQCEQIRAVATERLIRQVGTVDGVDVVRIESILRRILEL
ncbi:MAG: type II toxin-antitoxin system PemK/MazF family toxin [Actinomycetota bacterium]